MDINQLLANDLVGAQMGPDLHWFSADAAPERLAAVLVGMANSLGGTVLIGVAPRSGRILGVPDLPAALDTIFQATLLVDPSLVLPLPRQHVVKDQTILQVSVPIGLPHVYCLDGRYLARKGNQTITISDRDLRRLLIERGVVQFESQSPPGATLDDLDPAKVEGYLQALDLPGSESPEQFLLRRGCLVRVEDNDVIVGQPQLRPTYAALLLFGKQPEQWLPNANILAARFSGTSMADEFIKQDIGGPLPEQLRRAEAFVRDNLHSVVRMVGLTHQETVEYPLEAVRELLVNAVAHRDYNVAGDNIHLNIFSDRLEVRSPGGLPGPVNLDNLLEARFSRNAVIAQVLSDLGFVERLGYGLDRVMTAMRQHGLEAPRFAEIGGSFRVILYSGISERVSAPNAELSRLGDFDINQRQELALAFLLRRKRITNRDYQELCPEVSSETLRRDLVDLVDRGLLIKIGDKRATYYVLKK
jgi:ATP-dependent DNA helicase RecG